MLLRNPLLYSLSVILLISLGVYLWFAQPASTFARTPSSASTGLEDRAYPANVKEHLQPNTTYKVEIASSFRRPETASELIDRPLLTFDLPAERGEYLLVVGCLQGDLLKNHLSLELHPADDSATHQSSNSAQFIPVWERPRKPARPNAHPQSSIVSPAHSARAEFTTSIQRTPLSSAQERTFSLLSKAGSFQNPDSYAPCVTRLLSESAHLRIWLDRTDLQTVDAQIPSNIYERAQHLHDVFESIIVPRLHPWLGDVSDLDGDGKFSVVLTSQLNQLPPDAEPLVGLTWSGDYRRDLPAPYGNRSDLIFLNSTTEDHQLLAEVLIHEYVHAIAFDLHLESSSGLPINRQIDDWLNEGLAHVVETELTGTTQNIGDRLSTFQSKTEAAPLIVTNYHRAGLWREPGCRGATYSFLKWCHHQQGAQLIPRLLHSRQPSISNLETAMGQPFTDLFRSWSVHLARNSSTGTTLRKGASYQWVQAATSSRSFLLKHDGEGRLRVSLKNESESGVQLSLIPLSDPKAEEALLY